MTTEETTTAAPTLEQVLGRLLESLDQDAPPPDRLVLMQATEHIFACRLYERDGGPYEGFIIAFE